MQIIVFIILSILYFLIGVRFLSKKNAKYFFLLTVVLPLTSSLTPLHTLFQINVYYLFCLIVVINFLTNIILKGKLNKDIFIVSIAILGFIFGYLIYDVLLQKDNLEVVYLLKDIKPLLFLLFGFIFIHVLKNKQLDWNGGLAKKIMKYNFIATIVWFVILNKTPLISIVSNDSFFKLSETRYSAVGIVFVMLYFIAGLANKRKFDKYDLVYILVPLFLSGNRTVLFSLGIIYLLNMLLAAKNILTLLKRIVMFIGSGIVLFFGVFSFNEKLRERILTMFDPEIVVKQLTEYRFAPFIDKLASYGWYEYIFGKGIGETFFIPWFVWRKNIDNYNIYMDNIYFTLYVKYGVFFLIIFFILLHFIKQTKTNKRFLFLVVIYFAVEGLTTAFMYQTKFLFSLIVLASFRFIKNDGLEEIE